jgi:hypothetical protein
MLPATAYIIEYNLTVSTTDSRAEGYQLILEHTVNLYHKVLKIFEMS